MGRAVGIDLGTTNSLVACVEGRGSQVKCLPADEGSTLLPSAVAYVGGKITVGREARRLAAEHPLMKAAITAFPDARLIALTKKQAPPAPAEAPAASDGDGNADLDNSIDEED